MQTAQPAPEHGWTTRHVRSGWYGWLRRTIRGWWGDRPTSWSGAARAARPYVSVTVRVVAGAVIAYALTELLNPGSGDLTAPLTAMLVLQTSAVSSLKTGFVRVMVVSIGVLVAVGLSALTGLTWWSLGLAIAAAHIVARFLGLHSQVLETGISAMLILGVSAQTELAAEVRIVNTLIGAIVGMLFNLAIPVAIPITSTGVAVRELADRTADVLDRLSEATAMAQPSRPQLAGMLAQARDLSNEAERARTMLTQLSDARQLNVRALGTTDVSPILDKGVEDLEQCLLSVRALLSTLLPDAPTSGGDSDFLDPGSDDTLADDLRGILAVVISDTGDCVRGYGEMVQAEAADAIEQSENALAHSLEVLRETRSILTELMITESSSEPQLWVLRGSTMGAVEQILNQLDLERHAQVRKGWLDDESERLRLPPLLRDSLWHPERPIPRGMDRQWRETVGPTLSRRGAEHPPGSESAGPPEHAGLSESVGPQPLARPPQMDGPEQRDGPG